MDKKDSLIVITWTKVKLNHKIQTNKDKPENLLIEREKISFKIWIYRRCNKRLIFDSNNSLIKS